MNRIELKEAQYFSIISCNLISEGRLKENDAIFDFYKNKIVVKITGQELAKVH